MRGSGPRDPIIFLHGVGSTKRVWKPQLDHFGDERTAVAFDYPGYGESDFIEGATREDFAQAILDALDELGIRRAHICGLSLGGIIAMTIHALAPERCASLILADTFAVHPDGQGIHDRAVAASQSMSMRALAEARAELLLAPAASHEVREDVVDTMGEIDPAAYRLGARAVWLADCRDIADALVSPTLIIVGTEDSITPPSLSIDLHERIRGSRIAVIADAGHLTNLEQPEIFNRHIDRFLAEVEGRD